MKKILLLFFASMTSLLFSQGKIDFENFGLNKDQYLNGSDLSKSFKSGNVILPNFYIPEWKSWSGWSISSMTDNTTPGYANEFSCFAGTGAEGSKTYAIAYGTETILRLDPASSFKVIKSISLNNSTYAGLSMKNGDSFSKKFGGATGNDKDFLLLTIKGYKNGTLTVDTVDFYLADFRFEDNSKDYIVNEWTEVSLEKLGSVDSLLFTMKSTDVGVFGINTPTYFCLDNIIIPNEVAVKELKEKNLTVFPNPASNFITLRNIDINEEVHIYDNLGRKVIVSKNNENIDVSHMNEGIYFARHKGKSVKFIIKKI